MSIIQDMARAAVQKHGGVRKAAQALGIDSALLSKLQDGTRQSASPRTLKALGLIKLVRPIREAPGV